MARLDGVPQPGEDEVAGPGRPRAENADAVQPAGGCDRPDDARARGPVPADVTPVVLDDRDRVAVTFDGDRARERPDERMPRLDAGVDDADVDLACGAVERPRRE